MINPEQIRAARGLLDWSTADLAKQSGLTVNGINKIERGHVSAHRETLEILQKTFEGAGIEFLPGSGVRKKDRIIETYQGDGALQRLIIDVYNTLRDSGGEMLVAHLNEKDAIKSLDKEFLTEQIQKRKEANIKHRLIVSEDDQDLIPPFDTYRSIPKEYFSAYPFYIYGSKLALLSWEPSPRVVVIDDERFSESARKLFNFVWDRADKISRPKGKKS